MTAPGFTLIPPVTLKAAYTISPAALLEAITWALPQIPPTDSRRWNLDGHKHDALFLRLAAPANEEATPCDLTLHLTSDAAAIEVWTITKPGWQSAFFEQLVALLDQRLQRI